MKITKTVCDRCGSETVESSFFVEIDRQLDPAGSRDSVGENIDICGKCAATWTIKSLMRDNYVCDHEKGKEFLKWLKQPWKKVEDVGKY